MKKDMKIVMKDKLMTLLRDEEHLSQEDISKVLAFSYHANRADMPVKPKVSKKK